MNDDPTQAPGSPPGGRRSAEADELVDRLLRLADPGPELPADGADRVRAALRPAWRAAVRARRRRLAWAVGLPVAAGLVIAAALASVASRRAPAPGKPVATLAAVVGIVEVGGDGEEPAPLGRDEVGRAVVAGAWLRTGPAARAALRLGASHSLRLDQGTRVRLASSRAVELHSGAVYLDSGGAGEPGVEVRTAGGTVRETGTQFEVRHGNGRLTVRVREGSVTVRGAGAEQRLDAGSSMIVAADGARHSGAVEPDGPEWAWTRDVAPPFAVEGRSAADLLAWVSRETGLAVRFADSAAARLAAETVLHGTIAGLDPAEAPAVVLPGCGLAHRVVGRDLLITRPAGVTRRPRSAREVGTMAP